MRKTADGNVRYFVDMDLATKRIINWGYDSRHKLAQEPENPFEHRIFLTRGQYGKLEKRYSNLLDRAAMKS